MRILFYYHSLAGAAYRMVDKWRLLLKDNKVWSG